MTLVPPEPTPLTDAALAAIGAVVVEAARLEWTAAGLWTMLVGGGAESERLVGRTSATLKECVRIAEKLKADDLSGAVAEWATEAAELLSQRDRIAHSTWFNNEGGVKAVHLRSGASSSPDAALFHRIAHDLAMQCAKGFALCLRVDFTFTRDERQRASERASG